MHSQTVETVSVKAPLALQKKVDLQMSGKLTY